MIRWTAAFVLCSVVGASLRAAENDVGKKDVPTVRLSMSPLLPIQKPNPIAALDRLFARSTPATVIECDLIRVSEYVSEQHLFAELNIDRGSITFHGDKGHVRFEKGITCVRPSPDKKEYKYKDERQVWSIDFVEGRKGSVKCSLVTFSTRETDPVYRGVGLPIRQVEEKWKARLKVSLSDDFKGTVKWFVDINPK